MKTLVHRIALAAALLLVCAHASAKGVFADENDWVRYTSLSFALPLTSWDYDTDAADGSDDALIPLSFDSTGYTFDYQAYHVSPNKGFVVLTNWGFGGYSGDFELSDGTLKETAGDEGKEDEEDEEGEASGEDAKEDYETFTLDGKTGFVVYFNFGFGKAFQLAKKRIAIIPTAGVGLSLYMMTRAEESYEQAATAALDAASTASDTEDDTEDEATEDSDDLTYTYRAIDAVVNVFLNVTALFMFSEKYGLSLSCRLSVPVFGVGVCTTSADGSDSTTVYTLGSFGGVNFTPAVGLCIRL